MSVLDNPWHPVIGAAFRFVEDATDCTRTDLISPRREIGLVRARALFVAIVRQAAPLSYPEIGFWLGGRDHTTIMHMVKVIVPRLQARYAEFAALISKFQLEEAAKCTQ